MTPSILVHTLFFGGVVLIGCVVLSGLVRVLAGRWNLTFTPPTLLRCGVSAAAVAVAGGCGEGIFAFVLQAGGAPAAARLVGWIVAGSIIGISASSATPFMPALRSLLCGALGGAAAALVFNGLLGVHGDAIARCVAALSYCAILALAVVFPLDEPAAVAPSEEVDEARCPCGLPIRMCPSHNITVISSPAMDWDRSRITVSRSEAPGRAAAPGRVENPAGRSGFPGGW